MNINSKKGGWGEGRGGPLAILKSALDHLMDGKFFFKISLLLLLQQINMESSLYYFLRRQIGSSII